MEGMGWGLEASVWVPWGWFVWELQALGVEVARDGAIWDCCVGSAEG